MIKLVLPILTVLLFQGDFAHAAIISTLDFSDATTWSVTLTESNGSVQNNSSVTGGSILADEGSSGGANAGVRITVDLVGSISTAGFENISLSFFGLAGGGLEYDADLETTVSDSDGLRILGSGVDVNANSLNSINNTDAEDDFDAGTVFPSPNLASDFVFDSSVGDSVITDLTFVLQVNVGQETLQVSSVQILGDAVAVPEPGCCFAFGVLCAGGVITSLRKRKSETA